MAALSGVWELVDIVDAKTGGVLASQCAGAVRGVLIYTTDAWMAVAIESPLSTGGHLSVHYAGRVVVASGSHVVHTVVAGKPPFSAGTAQRRRAEMSSSNALALTTPDDEVGSSPARLSWRRKGTDA
jgi:hypothetical protein